MRGIRVAALAVWALTSGCAEKVVHTTERADASSGAGSDGGFAAPGCVDLSHLPTTPVISFEHDVMPIFGLTCVASACHDTGARKADLVLGDPVACGPPGTVCYDPAAKWKYTFKATIPRDLLTAVYSGLVNVPSKIVPLVNLVTPGDPASSFLLDTVMGTQNSSWYTAQCQSTDPSAGPCGPDMPLGTLGGFCADSPDRVQAIAQWISQGAPMN